MECLIVIPETVNAEKIYRNLYKKVGLELNLRFNRLNGKSIDYYLSKEFKNDLKKADVIIVDISNSPPEICYLLGSIHAIAKQKTIVTCDKNGFSIPDEYKNFTHVIKYDQNHFVNNSENTNESEYLLELLIRRISSTSESKNDSYLTIEAFYKKVSMKKYGEAWKHLSKDFQKRRYFDDEKLFTAGYDFTLSLDNVNIEILQDTGTNSKKYFVQYTEKAMVPQFKEIDDHSIKSLDDLRKIIRGKNKLGKLARKHGFDSKEIDRLTLAQFISPHRNGIINWLLLRKINKKRLENEGYKIVNEVFTPDKNAEASYSCVVQSTYEDDKWVISTIQPWQWF